MKILIVALVIAGLGCTKNQPKPAEVSWQTQGMESALKQAKAKKLPLLVYWGAVWCPPCNVLKSRVFSDPKFIQATKGFIPVYLDGDTENAQVWGDKLKASGYPTLMVLDSHGKEVVRVSTGSSAADIASTLVAAGNESVSLAEWVKLAANVNSAEIPKEKWMLLTNYSWMQNKDIQNDLKAYSGYLESLAKKAPKDNVEIRASLQLTAMELYLSGLKEKEKLEKAKVAQFKGWLENVLNHEVLWKAMLSKYVFSVKKYRDHLYSNSKDDFEAKIRKLMAKARQDNSSTFEDQLNTLFPLVAFLKDDASMPKGDQSVVDQVCTGLLKGQHDKKAYHAIMSDVGYYLHKAGLSNKAKEEMKRALKKSHSPYYLMSTLGYIERELGRKDEALGWYKKAYVAAEGGATQLQWAYKYLWALIKLKPEMKDKILDQAQKLLSKHTQRTDTFMGRSKSVLEAVKKKMSAWAEESKQKKKLEALYNSLGVLCGSRHRGLDYYQTSCKNYFKL